MARLPSVPAWRFPLEAVKVTPEAFSSPTSAIDMSSETEKVVTITSGSMIDGEGLGGVGVGERVDPARTSASEPRGRESTTMATRTCLLYTSDAADEEDSVDLGGR